MKLACEDEVGEESWVVMDGERGIGRVFIRPVRGGEFISMFIPAKR